MNYIRQSIPKHLLLIALLLVLIDIHQSSAVILTNQSCIQEPCTLGYTNVDVALVLDISNTSDQIYFNFVKK
jgi:hypothetical protein